MNPQIIAYAKRCRISCLCSGEFNAGQNISNEQYLLEVFRAEEKIREERAVTERLKQARFPAYKGFDEFDAEFQKGVSRQQPDTPANLEWLEALFNLILTGPPGTGKTHTALAIGSKAARNGYRAAFHTMDGLVHVLKTQEISKGAQARMRWLRKCDLIIIDEMGYLPVTKAEANFFFALVSELFEQTSFIITSNKGFDGWADVLGDTVLAAALPDRLTHRCQVLSFTDESCRLAHRKNIFNNG